MLVVSAGLFKETKVQTIIQGAIAVVIGIALVPYYGIAGVLAASILSNIYRDIDQLETSEVHHRGYLEYEELFWYFVIVGLGLLFLELALKESVLMALP